MNTLKIYDVEMTQPQPSSFKHSKEEFTADELNWTDLQQVDPVTRRVIGHARPRHDVDWLQFSKSSVKFICCEHAFIVFNLCKGSFMTHILQCERSLTCSLLQHNICYETIDIYEQSLAPQIHLNRK